MDLIGKFQGWAPCRVYWQAGECMVDWCWMGAERFTEPFFENTIEMRLRLPFNLAFRQQTPIDLLGKLSKRRPTVKPSGFIFHMSRCGSTLVSQMLAALPQNIVLSEPWPIDPVLRLRTNDPSVTHEQIIGRLQWLVHCLAEPRHDERHLFIKFDSWSTLDLDLIEQAFPDVPWIFLYRDPVEVIVSQMRQRGAQMIPGALGHLIPGLGLETILQMPPEEYCSRMLERFCESTLGHADSPNALFINYDKLPEAATTTMLEHFGVEYAPADIETMKGAARFNAKSPGVQFKPDSASKREGAGDAARRAASEFAEPVYKQLCELPNNG